MPKIKGFMSETEPEELTQEELAEMRRLIRMSQLARVAWGIVVGLVGLVGGLYVIIDHIRVGK
ncbi:MAG: hypothetical protein WCL60_01265 [Methylococcales bacterium]